VQGTTVVADRVSASPTAAGAPAEITPEQANALIGSRPYIALLVLASIVGFVVSLAAWCFLEGTYQLQQELFVHLPSGLGYHGALPLWYLLAVLGVAGLSSRSRSRVYRAAAGTSRSTA
jgi:hypothetical protein